MEAIEDLLNEWKFLRPYPDSDEIGDQADWHSVRAVRSEYFRIVSIGSECPARGFDRDDVAIGDHYAASSVDRAGDRGQAVAWPHVHRNIATRNGCVGREHQRRPVELAVAEHTGLRCNHEVRGRYTYGCLMPLTVRMSLQCLSFASSRGNRSSLPRDKNYTSRLTSQ